MIKVKHMFNFDSNSIDPTSMIPLYKQVANVITEEIDMGNRLIRLINKKPYPAYCTAVLQRTAGYQTRLTGNP